MVIVQAESIAKSLVLALPPPIVAMAIISAIGVPIAILRAVIVPAVAKLVSTTLATTVESVAIILVTTIVVPIVTVTRNYRATPVPCLRAGGDCSNTQNQCANCGYYQCFNLLHLTLLILEAELRFRSSEEQ